MLKKTMDKMPDKHFCQIYDAIASLRAEPDAKDSKELITNIMPKRRRKDVGGYRIIYWFDDTSLYLDVVGKRNDKAVYKQAKRKGFI